MTDGRAAGYTAGYASGRADGAADAVTACGASAADAVTACWASAANAATQCATASGGSGSAVVATAHTIALSAGASRCKFKACLVTVVAKPFGQAVGLIPGG